MSTLARSFSLERLAILALLGAGLAQMAAAGCEPELRRVEAPRISLDPFDARQRPAQVSVLVANRGDEECVSSIILRDALTGQAFRSSRDGIDLEFIERRRSALTRPGVLAIEDVRIPPGKEREIRFTPKLGFSAVPLSGERRFELTADLYDEALQVEQASAAFDFTIEVAASTAISLAGMSADRTVYLGDLRPGATGAAAFYVQSNGPYKVTIRSENGGMLKHTEDSKIAGVRYLIHADDQTAPLTRAMTLYRNERTPLLGERMVLGIRTPPDPLLFAGSYKDVIEVEVIPF